MIPTDGVAFAIRKRVSELESPGQFFSSGIFLTGIITIPIVLSILFFQGHVNSYIGTEAAGAVALIYIGSVLFFSVENGLKGQKKVSYAGVLNTFDRALRAIFQVILVYLSYELTALLVGQIVAIFIASCVGIWMYDIKPKIPTKEKIKSTAQFARYSWLGGFKMKSFAWLDTLVLNIFVASSFVGIYEISWNIASMFTLISSSISNAIFPEISDVSSDGDFSNIKNIFEDSTAFAGIFIIPGFFGALVLGEEVLSIYGGEFTQGYYILLILVVARTIGVYEGVFNQTLNAINRPDLAFRMNFAFVVLNVLLNFLLIYQFGWRGAAVATGLSSGVSMYLGYYYFSRTKLGTPDIPWYTIGKQVFSGAAMAVLVIGVKNIIPWEGIFVTVALVLFGAAFYMVVLGTVSERIREKMLSMVPIETLVL
jgi:O-antigen/teichoic acid export membrane protein